jgi:glycerophosphoryl diester phosphodiesterase
MLLDGWGVMRRSWRPMVLYTLVVWAGSSVVLIPLTAWVLDHLAGFGDVIVGNYSIHLWLLTPKGIAYLMLAGSVFLFTVILHATGLFQIVDSSRRESLTVRQVLCGIVASLRGLLRLSLALFVVSLPFGVLLAAGPGLAFLLLLSEHDINYYLTNQPTEWVLAIVLSALWVVPVVCGIVVLLLRWIYALPAWLDGHRPLWRALPASWRATDRQFWLLFRVAVSCLCAWLVATVLSELCLYGLAKHVLLRHGDSLRWMVGVVSTYLVATVIVDAVLAFLGMAWGVSVWMLCYRQGVGEGRGHQFPVETSRVFRPLATARRLFQLRILLPAIAVLAVGSWGLSLWFFGQEISEKRPLVIAHRAGAADAPENSLSAMRKVLNDGAADIVEIDVTLTRDGELVVAHDRDLMKQAEDPRVIAETDFADLVNVDIGRMFDPDFEGERLGRLDDFLGLAEGRLPMIIEFKHGDGTNLVEKAIAAVRVRGMEDEVIFMSLELDEVRKVQQLAPEIRVGYFASVEMGDLTELNVTCLGAKDRMVEKRFVADVQEKGMQIYSWTVDDPLRMVELIEAGVDGIITNDPVLAAKVIDKVYDLSPPTRVLLRFRRFWGVFDELGWWKR